MEHQSSPHETRGPWMLGVQYGLTAGATIFLALRLYVRHFIRRGLGWDDFFMGLAWVIAVYETVVMQLCVKNGFGYHLKYVESNIEPILYYSTIGEIVNPLGIGCVKVAIILFILRLINKATNSTWIRAICYVDLALFVPITLAFFLLLCFQCIPLSAVWQQNFPHDKCLDRKIVAIVGASQAATGAASDLLTSFLPILILSKLSISKATKILLCCLTGLGVVVSAFAIVRAVVGFQSFQTVDPTWSLVVVAVWATLEFEVGIMLACIPIFAPTLVLGLKSLSSELSRLRSRGRSLRLGHWNAQSAARTSNNNGNWRNYSKRNPEKDSMDSHAKVVGHNTTDISSLALDDHEDVEASAARRQRPQSNEKRDSDESQLPYGITVESQSLNSAKERREVQQPDSALYLERAL